MPVVWDLPEQAFKESQGRKSSPLPLFLHDGNSAAFLTEGTNLDGEQIKQTPGVGFYLWGLGKMCKVSN